MERARVSDREGRSVEFELPEPIIQHIQSFLFWKESARTSLISKPWYAAWCTRPSLSLEQRDFRVTGGFSNFARTTLQRYIQLNRKIDRFDFSIDEVNDEVSASFTDEIIIDALKLGVNDLIVSLISTIPLPVQVFSPSSVTRAFLSSCLIDDSITKGQFICSPRLKLLVLSWVSLSDDAIRAILARCPLIEVLDLTICEGLTKINLSGMHNLREFTISHPNDSGLIRPLVEFEDHSLVNSVTQYFFLTKLSLYQVDTSNSFFHDFAIKFPCLESLTLYYTGGHENLQLSSHSLMYLTVDHAKYNSVQLDVPNLYQFSYSCSKIPHLSFSTDMEECESEITFECRHNLGVSSLWFVELREFLKELKLSIIYLKPHYYWDKCAIPVEDIPGSFKPEVETLILAGYFSSPTALYAFLSGILWTCHPKFLSVKSDSLDSHESLYMRLVENAGQSGPIATQNLLSVHGLEEVIVEFREADLMEWKPILWEDVLGACNSIQDERRCIRFQLIWQDHTNSIPEVEIA